MSRQRRKIAERVGDRRMIVSRPVNSGNGRNGGSGLLSWYFAQPRIKGLSYALTANGYMILPNDLHRSREELDANELMM